jgi:MFS family permease
MTLSLLGTGLGLAAQAYVIASKKSLWVFLLSRVITGSFAGSSPISKAYLADVSADNLPRNLAWRDAASTLAFLVGPLLGGVFLGSTASLSFVIAISSVAYIVGSTCGRTPRSGE